jgi:glyoxylase I family protein
MSKVKTDSEGRLEPLISGVLSHVTLCIRDAVDSRKFYVDFLGLKELPRMPQPQPGLWLQAGNKQIHLLVPIDPGELPPQRRLTETPMAPHIAFSVSNLDATVQRARAAGHTVIISEFAEGQAFITDPSGNIIEFNSMAVGT